MNIKREECYEESTDDEGGARHHGHQLKAVVPKKEEDVDTDNDIQATDDFEVNEAAKGARAMKDPHEKSIERRSSNDEGGGSQAKVIKTSFEERLKELTAYKAEHGHLKVKKSEDKRLAQFCVDVRRARKRLGTMKLDDGRIVSLDALGFDWEPQNRKEEQFQERLDELKAYKEEHGHLKVKRSEDKSLARFCSDARRAHRGDGTMTMTKERIAALDDLEFDWEPQRKSRQDSFTR